MKKGLTLLVFLIDNSGSMHPLRRDTVLGFNSLIKDQKELCEKDGSSALISLALFNTDLQVLNTMTNIFEFEELSEGGYPTYGGTSLLDTSCQYIDMVGRILSKMDENERPEKVLFNIITDGEENCSRRFKISDLKKRIEEQEKIYNWTFNFIGANIDSFATGSNYGMSTSNTANFGATSEGVARMFRGVSNYTADYRSSVNAQDFCIGHTLYSYVKDDE